MATRTAWRFYVFRNQKVRGGTIRTDPAVHDELLMRSFTENRPNQLSLTDTAKHHTEQSKLLFYDMAKALDGPRYLLGVTVFRQDMQCREPAGSGMMFAPS